MSQNINKSFADRFTLAHGAAGVALGRFTDVSFFAALALAAGWELAERPLKEHVPEIFPHSSQDTKKNMLGDVAAAMLGWRIGRYLRQRG